MPVMAASKERQAGAITCPGTSGEGWPLGAARGSKSDQESLARAVAPSRLAFHNSGVRALLVCKGHWVRRHILIPNRSAVQVIKRWSPSLYPDQSF